jgi:hypothetical protein
VADTKYILNYLGIPFAQRGLVIMVAEDYHLWCDDWVAPRAQSLFDYLVSDLACLPVRL